jgi:DNA-directed RNA polymerase specialized sigma24 family protein
MKPPPFDIELHVDRHGASLRRLARTLAQDPDAAEDAVQETWLQALRSLPREQSGVGAWLAAVLRTVRRRTRRSDARRRQHEAAAVRADAVGDHAAVLAREVPGPYSSST